MVREIITPKTKTITIEIPEEYIGKTIEVLAFDIISEVEELQRNETFEMLNSFYSEFSIDFREFHFDREEIHER